MTFSQTDDNFKNSGKVTVLLMPGLLLRSVCLGSLVAFLLAGCGGTSPDQSDARDRTSSAQVSKQYLRNISESLSDSFGIDNPPEVKVVRATLPEELDDTLLACVAEEGFPLTEDGVIKIPEGQQDAYNMAQYVCRMRYPVIERYAQPLKTKQIKIQYDWTIQFVIPCLERQGFKTSNAPTEARFIDTWNSDPYYPMAQVSLSEKDARSYNQRMSDLEKICPQAAPSSVTWDGQSIKSWINSHSGT